ncbi:MAG TPA: TolC family protein [Polyangia bacterium]|nr:TolC family protein [Polyangia bacterium]
MSVLLATGGLASAKEQLTVEQATDLALKQNLRLMAQHKRAEVGHDVALSAGGRMLPSVHLSEEYQHWDCAAALSLANFAGGAQCKDDVIKYAQEHPVSTTGLSTAELNLLGPLFAGPPIVARAQDTNSFVATISQPLLGLLHLGYDYSAAHNSALAGDAQLKVAQAATVQAVRTAYLQTYEARALEQIAIASVTELQDQVKVSQARLKAGVITNADLLRVQVAEANARQQQIVAHTSGITTTAQLLNALGLRPDDDVELVEPTTLLDQSATALPDLGAATSHAEANRPEVLQLKHSTLSADRNRTARYFSLLPEVDAEGGYVRTDGQLFAPANQWYVGVKASWTIWEWGATFFQARAASKQAQAAALDLEDEKRGVAVEVHNAIAQTQAAAVAVDVAKEAIASAQEAYRVEQALVNAGSATTTDLLNSQSELTTARLNYARSRYDLAIQHVALTRVLGE